MIERIAAEESQARAINEKLLAAGESHQPLPE